MKKALRAYPAKTGGELMNIPDPARPAEPIIIILKCTHWILSWTSKTGQTKNSLWQPCRGMFSPAVNWWGYIRKQNKCSIKISKALLNRLALRRWNEQEKQMAGQLFKQVLQPAIQGLYSIYYSR